MEGSTYLAFTIMQGLSSLTTQPFSLGLSKDILNASIVLLAKAFPRKLFGFRYKKAHSFLSLSLQTSSRHSYLNKWHL